jgi:hypothetical protein
MKRQIAAGLSILAVAAGVGWKLSSHPGASADLQEVSLNQRSEHSQPGPANALAGIRIRLSGSDVGANVGSTNAVPHIAVAAE